MVVFKKSCALFVRALLDTDVCNIRTKMIFCGKEAIKNLFGAKLSDNPAR